MNNKNLLKYLLITLLLFLPLCYIIASVTLPNPLGVNSIQEFIKKIADFIRNLALVISPIILVYAGILYIFSGGDPTKANKAKDVIIWTVVGLLIVLSGDALINFITYLTK